MKVDPRAFHPFLRGSHAPLDTGRAAFRPRRGRAASRPATAAAIAFITLVGASASGCFTDSDGLPPPSDQFYFPTNIVVSPGGTALYVTNSDFDLQYNGGTVQVLDLGALRDTATKLQGALAGGIGAEACSAVGLAKNPQTILNPGPCSPLESGPFVKGSAAIGAFASGAVLVHKPEGAGARLFVSVRGDPSITYFDVADDRDPQNITSPCGSSLCLECSASGSTRRCGPDHRVGEDPSESLRELTLPVEPIGIAASEDGAALITAHQTEQAASLVINRWNADTGSGVKPTLEYILYSLPPGPTDVATIPVPAAVTQSGGTIAYQPGFIMTYRVDSVLDLLRYYDDKAASPARPFLSRAGSIAIGVNKRGDDSRGIAIDGSERRACEAACGASGASPDCLRDCAEDVPHRVFVANREPPSLLVGDIRTTIVEEAGQTTAAFDELAIRDTLPLTFGASRVAMGNVIGEDGEPHVRAFVLAFDSRLVFVYNPEARAIEAVIRTGRGPHAIAFDTGGEGDGKHSFMYIGHFTDSYVGVVDLDMRKPQTFGAMFMTVGKPVPPRESK